MKTAREISNDRPIRHLERNWGYSFSRQHGSHIVLTAEEPARHSIPIPERGTIGPGLLRSIFKQVCDGKGITLADLLKTSKGSRLHQPGRLNDLYETIARRCSER